VGRGEEKGEKSAVPGKRFGECLLVKEVEGLKEEQLR